MTPESAPPADGPPGRDAAPVAVFLSLSEIARDPRIGRHCRALTAEGWRVVSIGFGESRAVAEWRHVGIPDIPVAARVDRRVRRIANLLAVRLFPSRAEALWRDEARHRALQDAAATIAAADLVVANDPTALPAAIALAHRCGAALIYDTHEYAAVEREEDRRWRLLYPPYIRALERQAIAAGALWMTVSNGIADGLARDYGLQRRPAVIRNMPDYQAQPFRPAGSPMLVHYHGVLTPGRGLEALIDSVPLWREGLRLRIRGPGEPGYRNELAGRVRNLGCGGRVSIEPALPVAQLVAAANDADIGIHMLPPFGAQNRFALPNKLFEYVMAGLAVVVSDLPEMGAIIRAKDIGTCVQTGSSAAIAETLNGLTGEQVDRWKANALAAAKELCWDEEQHRFVAFCAGALRTRAGSTLS